MSEQDVAGAASPRPDLSELSAASVVGSDGQRVGRVHDIYLQDATSVISAISVAIGRMGDEVVLVPAAAIDSQHPDDDGRVHLQVTAKVARSGLPAPQTLHADPAMMERAVEALGLRADGTA